MYEIYKDLENGFILKINGEVVGCFSSNEEAIKNGEINKI
jgi:hypothetical protein